MSVIQTKPPAVRDPGPYPAKRTCSGCGCFLSRSNPSETCAPCNGGEWQDGEVNSWRLHQAAVARLEYGLAA